MLSIIICSKNGDISTELKNNFNETTGCSYELIVIDNSEKEFSIFSAYNKGIEKATYENICFVHEDVKFLTMGWGNKVIQHLQLPNVGFVGVAGGRGLSQVPLGWESYDSQVNIFHFDKKDIYKVNNVLRYSNKLKSPVTVAALDGVFLCCKKSILNTIRFDENINGFHGYDIDICLNALNHKLYNYVVFDIDILHYSHGKFDSIYMNNLLFIYQKWNNILPYYANEDIADEEILKVERINLLRLRKKMIRAKMHKKQVYETIKNYKDLINYHPLKLRFVIIDYSFIKYTSALRNKLVA
jgi:hypothetical protein